MGITLWFQATAYYSWNRGDFASEQAWKNFLAKHKPTHPLNGQRLRVLAQRLKDHADDFTQIVQKSADKERILFIANGILDRIIPVLEDIDLQYYMAALARNSNISSLAPRPATSV